MIDRTQLTEALARVVTPTGVVLLPGESMPDPSPTDWQPIVDAARLLLDFPTDEQVEAAATALKDQHPQWTKTTSRKVAWAALEAVRETMIGHTADG